MTDTIEWVYAGGYVAPFRRPRLSWFTRFPPYYDPELKAIVLGDYYDEEREIRVVLLQRLIAGQRGHPFTEGMHYFFEDQCINDLEIQPTNEMTSKTPTTPATPNAPSTPAPADSVRCLSCGGLYRRNADGSIPCGH